MPAIAKMLMWPAGHVMMSKLGKKPGAFCQVFGHPVHHTAIPAQSPVKISQHLPLVVADGSDDCPDDSFFVV
jgi:hypothetical protein